MRSWPPEKLEVPIVDMQHRTPFQFLTSLLRRRGGWFAISTILLALMLMVGCGRQSTGSRPAAINMVESVTSRQVIHDGKPWVEVTISQRVDPKAPAYVVGIRESKWANRLSWALFEQRRDPEMVISRFRLHPVGETNEITLSRDDFEWYPKVSGFKPIEVVLKAEPDGPANGSQPIRSETNRTSSATGSRR